MVAYALLNSIVDRIAWRSRLLRLKHLDAVRTKHALARQAAFHLPKLENQISAGLVAAVQVHGAYLEVDGAQAIEPDGADVIKAVIAAGPNAWKWLPGSHLLESEHIYFQNPDLYCLGLEPRLLDLAEYYLIEPCYYMGCSLKLERVTPSVEGVRQWHLDIEDNRLFRLIIYLNDVVEGGGAFQYIDEEQSWLARSRLGYRSGYVADDAMRQVIRESNWRSALAPTGALIAFDGTRVFHRVLRPSSTERFSLTLTYSSRHPRQILRPVRLLLSSRRQLQATLSERQKASIPGARWV